MYYCDVALMDSVRESLDLPCFDRAAELADFPLLEAWLARMEAVPAIAAHLAERGTIVPEFAERYLRERKQKKQPAGAGSATAAKRVMPVCAQCGRNDDVIPCLRGKPGAEALARAKRGEVKLSGCTRSAAGWCTACSAFI